MQKDMLQELKKQNRAKNIKEYDRSNLFLNSWPQVIFVELTQNCNLYCEMCRKRELFNPSKNMTFSLFTRIADQVFPRAEIVDLRGFGESTILKDLPRFIEYANRFDVQLRLFTNLTVSSGGLWDTLARFQFTLAISFDGASKAVFEKIRTGSNYDIVINNLDLLIKLYSKYGYDIKEYLYFSTTVQKENLPEIIDIMIIMRSYGIKTIKLFPIGCPINDTRNLIHYPDEVKKLLKDASRFAQDNNINLEIGESLHPTFTIVERVIDKCIHPWGYVFFDYKGNVGYCDNLIGQDCNNMGSIRNNYFLDIWNNQKFVNLRRKHSSIKGLNLNENFSECNLCYHRRYNEIEHLSYPPHSSKIVNAQIINRNIMNFK